MFKLAVEAGVADAKEKQEEGIGSSLARGAGALAGGAIGAPLGLAGAFLANEALAKHVNTKYRAPAEKAFFNLPPDFLESLVDAADTIPGGGHAELHKLKRDFVDAATKKHLLGRLRLAINPNVAPPPLLAGAAALGAIPLAYLGYKGIQALQNKLRSRGSADEPKP